MQSAGTQQTAEACKQELAVAAPQAPRTPGALHQQGNSGQLQQLGPAPAHALPTPSAQPQHAEPAGAQPGTRGHPMNPGTRGHPVNPAWAAAAQHWAARSGTARSRPRLPDLFCIA